MISPIGNSYSFYTSGPYASGHTTGAARTALASMSHEGISSVLPVDDVPEVFSNDETERVWRTLEELQQDCRNAYEIMNSLNPRNAMQEDKKPDAELVSVSVSLKTAVCPECGTTYVAGGKTRTVMRYGEELSPYEKQQTAYSEFANGTAGMFDKVA